MVPDPRQAVHGRRRSTWRRQGCWCSPAASWRTWTLAFSADGTSGTMVVTDGPYTEVTEYLGGITIIEVATIEEAREWAARVAEGCGWPQEVREVK